MNYAIIGRLGYRANANRTVVRRRSFKRTACALTSINVSPPIIGRDTEAPISSFSAIIETDSDESAFDDYY